MLRLFLLVLCLLCLNACGQPEHRMKTGESCRYVRSKLSPDGQTVMLLETAPSTTKKTDKGFVAYYNFQRTQFKCEKANCTQQQNIFTLPANIQKPKIFWAQDKNKENLGLVILGDRLNQKAIFLPKDATQFIELNPYPYSLPSNSSFAFSGEIWTYFSPLIIPIVENNSTQKNLTKAIKEQLGKITKTFDDFIFDLEESSLGETFAIYSQSKGGMLGITNTTYRPIVSNIVYDGRTKKWMRVANYSPADQNIKLYVSHKDELILGGVNRAVNVKNSKAVSMVENLEYAESFRTFPIVNRSTGQFVGLSSLKNASLLEGGFAEQAINTVIRKDLEFRPFLTVKQMEVTTATDGITYVIQYKNWQTDSSLFKYVKIFKNAKTFESFLPCSVGQQINQKPNSVNLNVVVKNIGTEIWPSRVLSLTQDSPKGAVVFLKGGPRGHVFNGALLSRIYGFYLQRGFDVYAFEYSGMTLLQSDLDQRLHVAHEKALEKDLNVISNFIDRDLNNQYDELVLHSESFGSILALGLLAKKDMFSASIFLSPWVQHQSPSQWQNSPESQFSYEDYLFGINHVGTGSFVNWMNNKRDAISELHNSFVVIGEREDRGPRKQMSEFFRNKGAEVHILKNGTHELTPVLSSRLVDKYLKKTSKKMSQKNK